ncbi:hypothetical protein [Fischerella sp.]|uniref:hypothetical protein n=1 Tax=Fischerella sp. TaxID=1191 RepID=UPI0025C35402|nr:hypothetical protein [Fischerella sp.]
MLYSLQRGEVDDISYVAIAIGYLCNPWLSHINPIIKSAIAFESFDWDFFDSIYAIIVTWRLKL